MVQVCGTTARALPSPTLRPKKWDSFLKADLATLARVGRRSQQFTFCLTGIGVSGAIPFMSAKTPYNAAKTLLCRLYAKQPQREWGVGPRPGAWAIAAKFRHLLLPHLDSHELSFQDWLSSMPAHRKPALQRAHDEYERAGLRPHHKAFQSFVKSEILPGFRKAAGVLMPATELVDRAIHGPHDVGHTLLGPVMKPKITALKKQWTSSSPVFYASVGPEPLHEFLQDLVAGQRQYFMADFTAFDMSYSDDCWDFVEYYYPHLTADQRSVLQAWRRPRGTFGPLKYRARTVNASGRDDTALANGLLNGFASYLSAVAAWYEVALDELTEHHIRSAFTFIRLAVCGDDSLGWLPACDEERMSRFRTAYNFHITEFGFQAKLLTTPHPEQCVFLAKRPIHTSRGWFWAPTIGRAIYKLGWTTVQGGRDLMAIQTGVAAMHAQCSRHVPILSDIAKRVRRLREGCRRTPVLPDPNRPWEWCLKGLFDYDSEALASTARAYSFPSTAGYPVEFPQIITVEDLRSAITAIEGVERLPCIISHPVLSALVLLDDL